MQIFPGLLNIGRYRAAHVALEDKGKRFMVIGGQSNTDTEQTVEILDENGWQLSTSNNLPLTITASCAFLLGQDKVMVTGGIQNSGTVGAA